MLIRVVSDCTGLFVLCKEAPSSSPDLFFGERERKGDSS